MENEGLMVPLKEEDRLSATVWAVTEAAAVVPRGVFVVNSDDGCLSWNPCFIGLGHSKAVSLSHYLHLRPPRKPWNTCLLTAASPNPAIDCLDSVDTDFPPGWKFVMRRL
ncbi:radial spoke head protein 9 homolog [Schistocerca serialis cubense]|uniref:radial spoke head protein 9 homolog n=1 Tax=Schistocerca serialis cubense TaxID=2023355 RepID=UPI00214EE8BD|nr:radial spoke head protein 9 homolog [Schistocerca serialis cubense]